MKNYVKIINIIDRSGSMNSILETAINGFNEFIQEQQTVDGDALVSTMLFSTSFNKLYENKDIKNCELLTKETFIPDGMTALYDAIGSTIDNEIDQLGTLPKEERPEKTLCVILTDGYENRSTKYSKTKISEMVGEMKENFNWEFIFLAANEEAAFTAETMGISRGNSFAFANTESGLKDAYMSMSSVTKTYRTSKSVKMDSMMDDYKSKTND